MKRILLISGNYFPEQTGIGRYNGEMMTWFSENGYHCEVITSYPYYPQWEINYSYTKKRYWFTTEQKGLVKIHRCPLYVPKVPSGFKRILLDFSFSITSFIALIRLFLDKKFDLVIVVAPPFQLGMLGSFYKRVRGGKFLYHVQDMQIEAARDLGMIKSKKIIQLLLFIERYIFKRADLISSISDGMIKRIENLSKKSVLFFPNWSDINKYYPINNKTGLKEKFGYHNDDIIVLYSGAIGEKQGLDIILSLASRFIKKTEVKFVICGSGPYTETLKQKAKDTGSLNVFFMPLQPSELLNEFLNMADIHLIIQKIDASDLVMPSKLTNILAVGGLSVTTANLGTNLQDEIEKNNIGIVVPAENVACLYDGLQEALNENTQNIKINARRYAEQNLAINNVLGKLLQKLV